jgi:hypothetical protein
MVVRGWDQEREAQGISVPAGFAPGLRSEQASAR